MNILVGEKRLKHLETYPIYTMFDKIILLREKGYVPDTILDIGAYHGHWTSSMRQIYGESKYHLFEAIDYSELKRLDNDPRASVHIVILNDKIDRVNWYQMKNTGDSMFREKTHHFTNCEVIQRETTNLNTYIQQTGILRDSRNILIKIDCQGAEIPILKGATSILAKTDFIILEIPLFGQYNEGVPTFLEHIQFMDTIGFIPYDMVDSHYINGFNMQVDILFINKNHSFNRLVNGRTPDTAQEPRNEQIGSCSELRNDDEASYSRNATAGACSELVNVNVNAVFRIA